MKIWKTLITLIIAALGFAPFAAAETITVDPLNVSDQNVFDRIQPAIDFAKNGDVIEVFPGTYEGGLIIENKSISLVGLEASGETTLKYTEGPVITIKNADIALSIEGFSVGDASEGVLSITNASVTLTDMQFSNTIGTAIESKRSTEAVQNDKQFQLSLKNCGIRNGVGIGDAPSVLAASAGITVRIEDSYIEDNSGGTAVIEASDGTEMSIFRSFICGNSAQQGGAIRVSESSIELKSSVISGNSGDLGGALYIENATGENTVNLENLHLIENSGTGTAVYFTNATQTSLTNTVIIGVPDGAFAFADGDNSGFTMQYSATLQGGSMAVDGEGTALAFTGGEGMQVFEDVDDLELHDGEGCVPGSWEPQTDSPLLNTGDPELMDPFEFPNHKESNIGAYGGPEAMWPAANSDEDEYPDLLDNCPLVENEVQDDADDDGIGDVCDPDPGISKDQDNDGVLDQDDNCVTKQNPDQEDLDQDGQGDVCDKDDDGDGEPDQNDCAPEDKTRYPGATEICNGLDDDCDGVEDNGLFCGEEDAVSAPEPEEGWNAVNEDDDSDISTYALSTDEGDEGCQKTGGQNTGLWLMMLAAFLVIIARTRKTSDA